MLCPITTQEIKVRPNNNTVIGILAAVMDAVPGDATWLEDDQISIAVQAGPQTETDAA